MFLLLALESEFDCFLRSWCFMEMWCPDDIGRNSWDWVGPPAWETACFNSPEWGGGSSPVKTEPPQIVLLLLFSTRHSTMRLYQQHRSSNWQTRCRVTWESESRRLRHPLEPSSTHSCERSNARKTGAQLRDNRRSAKNDAKCVEKTQHRHHGELVEIMSRFKVRTALRGTATRSIL